MRALITISVTFAALISVMLTGNFLRVRNYLWAHLAGQVIAEGYLLLFEYDPTVYPWLFMVASVPILATAVAIAAKVLGTVPDSFRTSYLVLPVILAVLAFYATPFQTTPMGVFLMLEAGILGVVGLQTVFGAVGHIEDSKERAPYRTLGSLWLVQSLMFAMFATGFKVNYGAWEAIGEWLPALVFCVGILKLCNDFRQEREAELQV